MLRVFAKEILDGRIVLDKLLLEKASNRKVWDTIPSSSVGVAIKNLKTETLDKQELTIFKDGLTL